MGIGVLLSIVGSWLGLAILRKQYADKSVATPIPATTTGTKAGSETTPLTATVTPTKALQPTDYIATRLAQGGNLSESERFNLTVAAATPGSTWNYATSSVAPNSGMFDGTPNPNIPGMVWSNAANGWVPADETAAQSVSVQKAIAAYGWNSTPLTQLQGNPVPSANGYTV